jgi:hypothetical protein
MASMIDLMRFYIDKMLREVGGMKVLMVDAETLKIVSTVFSQSEILEQEVYLVQRLDAEKGEQLFHLKVWGCCIAHIPPRLGRTDHTQVHKPQGSQRRLVWSNLEINAAVGGAIVGRAQLTQRAAVRVWCAGGVLHAAHARKHCAVAAGAP